MPYQLPDFAGGIAQMFAMGQQVAAQKRQNQLLELQQQQMQQQQALTQAEQQYQMGNTAPLQQVAPWRFQQLEQGRQEKAATLAKNKAIFDIRANPNMAPEAKVSALEQIDPDAAMQLRKDLFALQPRQDQDPLAAAAAFAKAPPEVRSAYKEMHPGMVVNMAPSGAPGGELALSGRAIAQAQTESKRQRMAVNDISELIGLIESGKVDPTGLVGVGSMLETGKEILSRESDPNRRKALVLIKQLETNQDAMLGADEFGNPAEKIKAYDIGGMLDAGTPGALLQTLKATQEQIEQDYQYNMDLLSRSSTSGKGRVEPPKKQAIAQQPSAQPPTAKAFDVEAFAASLAQQGLTPEQIAAAIRSLPK